VDQHSRLIIESIDPSARHWANRASELGWSMPLLAEPTSARRSTSPEGWPPKVVLSQAKRRHRRRGSNGRMLSPVLVISAVAVSEG
jgi:hypothetical protein